MFWIVSDKGRTELRCVQTQSLRAFPPSGRDAPIPLLPLSSSSSSAPAKELQVNPALLPWQGVAHTDCASAGISRRKIFIYIWRAVTQLQRFTGKKLREENSGKKTRRDIPGGREAPPSTQYLGSVQNCCGFTKRLGFTEKYRRGARQGAQPGTNSLLELENATGLVENSSPRAGCMHSHGISTPMTGLKAWKRHLQTCPVLGCMEFSLQEEFCRREDRTQGQDKAKQGSAPLPGTQLLLQPKKQP